MPPMPLRLCRWEVRLQYLQGPPPPGMGVMPPGMPPPPFTARDSMPPMPPGMVATLLLLSRQADTVCPRLLNHRLVGLVQEIRCKAHE